MEEDRFGPSAAAPVVGFRGPQVCALVGITYRQLDYWARTGLLRPSLAEARGSGTQRLYSYHDVLELKIVKQLLDAGVSLQRARRALDCLRDGLGADVASTSLVLTGADSVLAHSDGEVVDLLRGGQGVLNIVPLAGVVGSLQAAIHQLQLPGAADPTGRSAQAAEASGSSVPAPRAKESIVCESTVSESTVAESTVYESTVAESALPGGAGSQLSAGPGSEASPPTLGPPSRVA